MSDGSADGIRRLGPPDAEDWVRLRLRALQAEPLAFASSPETDLARDPDAVRERFANGGEENLVLGAFRPQLVGTLGIYRDRQRKSQHKAHVWGMWVEPDHRRRGVAAALLDEALARAGAWPGVGWIHLSVSSSATGARRLYESRGFRVWGEEPDALRHDGRAVSEHHLVLELS